MTFPNNNDDIDNNTTSSFCRRPRKRLWEATLHRLIFLLTYSDSRSFSHLKQLLLVAEAKRTGPLRQSLRRSRWRRPPPLEAPPASKAHAVQRPPRLSSVLRELKCRNGGRWRRRRRRRRRKCDATKPTNHGSCGPRPVFSFAGKSMSDFSVETMATPQLRHRFEAEA